MAQNTTISIAYKIEGADGGFKKLTADAESLHKLMVSNVQEVQRYKKSLIDFAVVSSGIKNVDKAVGELANTLSSLTRESLDFDKAMKSANTMAGKDSAGFKKLKDDVADLSKQLPIARDELANGLYQVISNGVPEDNWLEFLQTSARSAVGGIADINKVVGVTSTVIKNYGLEWSAAADIQDKIQLTAKNGVTSFEQLAQALPRVTGNAATLGVSIDELLGTFATLTGVSGNTAEVSTQLAAIFTALVKPSSEASQMAEKMGIQFDAAAIKAAGGFQNFLTKLDSSVKAYAQANGVLEQEVYGRLFGSAESLRALIPLQGELAEKFNANVATMVDSAGTMDAAYNDMASTGEAVTQMLKNNYAAIIDVIAGFTSAAQPYINFIAGLVSTAANITILVEAFKALNGAQYLTALRMALLHGRTIAVNTVIKATALFSKKTALALEMLRVASKGSERAIFGLQIALRGLLMAAGVGAAIWAVTAIIEHFCNATYEASDSVEKLDDSTEEYTRAASSAKVQIEKDIKALKGLIDAKKSTKEAVDKLNETYGDLFGSHKTAEEWYKILTEKSQLYIKQMGYEAQARTLAAKIAEAAINKELAAEKKAELERSGKAKKTVSDTVGGSNTSFVQIPLVYDVETKEYKEAKAALEAAEAEEAALQKRMDTISSLAEKNKKEINAGLSETNDTLKVSEMTWQQVSDAIDKTETSLKNTTDSKKIKSLKAYNEQLKARKKLLEKELGIGTKHTSKKKTLVADPKTKEDLKNNLEIKSKKLTGEDTPEQKALIKDIALLKDKLEAIELVELEASRPTEIKSLEDVDNELNYQRALRKKATTENIAGIDAEIKRLEKLKDGIEQAAQAPIPIDQITTYEQLNSQLAYFNAQLEKADATQRASFQERINRLNELKKTWDKALNDLKKPGEISTLDTIGKLDEAISYYQAKQNDATEDEIQNNQKVIDALDRKRAALQRGVKLPSLMREADEINKLTGRDYKVKIRGMGFDELTAKIKEINRMLEDTENPVTDSQRKNLESLRATYEKWRKEVVYSFGTVQEGWDGLKGLGSGIEGITSALSGNANAWQTVTGIIDGFLQIYDGIKTIVGIINMLTEVSEAHAAAKVVENVAVVASVGAQAAEAATADATAAAQLPVVAANKAVAASYMELAAAAFFAAHAYIPFAGFGIASGFVAAAKGIVETIGATAFANGGLVSGPTVGLIGEYAGASNNPEVVAPLDKLRNMLVPRDGMSGKVTFKIDGRTLVGVLERETNLKNRS